MRIAENLFILLKPSSSSPSHSASLFSLSKLKNMNTKMNMNPKIIALIIAIAFSVWSSSCTATRVSHWRKLKAASSTFNVLDYGAKGDGHADDTKVIDFSIQTSCSLVSQMNSFSPLFFIVRDR